MARISSKLVTIVAAWFALCSAAFAAAPSDSTAPSAQSQAPISASMSSDLPVATTTEDQTAKQIDAWLANDGSGARPPQGPGPDLGPPPPRAIHGEASVGIGSNGAREAYVAADIPIGDRSDLGVSLSDTKLPSYHGRGGGEYTSVGVSLYIDTSKNGRAPCGQPRWGEPLPSDQGGPACAGGEAAGLMPGINAMAAQAAR